MESWTRTWSQCGVTARHQPSRILSRLNQHFLLPKCYVQDTYYPERHPEVQQLRPPFPPAPVGSVASEALQDPLAGPFPGPYT